MLSLALSATAASRHRHANYVSNLLRYSNKLITLADVIATTLGCPGSVLAIRLGLGILKGQRPQPSSNRDHEHRGRTGSRSPSLALRGPLLFTTTYNEAYHSACHTTLSFELAGLHSQGFRLLRTRGASAAR